MVAENNSVPERLWRAEDLSWIGIELKEGLVEEEQEEHLRSIRLSRDGTEQGVSGDLLEVGVGEYAK